MTDNHRFLYVLAAPVSVSTKLNEDTMTYLNQGQAYEIKFENRTDSSETRKGFMCSIINIGFHERHMQQAEADLWQQWATQHPNEQIFTVDMKLSYNVFGVEYDGMNKYEFLWDSSKVAGVFIRINSISTEFTPKKHGGEKGVPFKLSVETFTYNSKTHDSFFTSAAYCQIKVFKPKGAERKIRSDKDKLAKRPANEQEKYHRPCDQSQFKECPLNALHPSAKRSALGYYRHSHGHFASKQYSLTSSGTAVTGTTNQHQHHQHHHHHHSPDDVNAQQVSGSEADQQQQQCGAMVDNSGPHSADNHSGGSVGSVVEVQPARKSEFLSSVGQHSIEPGPNGRPNVTGGQQQRQQSPVVAQSLVKMHASYDVDKLSADDDNQNAGGPWYGSDSSDDAVAAPPSSSDHHHGQLISSTHGGGGGSNSRSLFSYQQQTSLAAFNQSPHFGAHMPHAAAAAAYYGHHHHAHHHMTPATSAAAAVAAAAAVGSYPAVGQVAATSAGGGGLMSMTATSYHAPAANELFQYGAYSRAATTASGSIYHSTSSAAMLRPLTGDKSSSFVSHVVSGASNHSWIHQKPSITSTQQQQCSSFGAVTEPATLAAAHFSVGHHHLHHHLSSSPEIPTSKDNDNGGDTDAENNRNNNNNNNNNNDNDNDNNNNDNDNNARLEFAPSDNYNDTPTPASQNSTHNHQDHNQQHSSGFFRMRSASDSMTSWGYGANNMGATGASNYLIQSAAAAVNIKASRHHQIDNYLTGPNSSHFGPTLASLENGNSNSNHQWNNYHYYGGHLTRTNSRILSTGPTGSQLNQQQSDHNGQAANGTINDNHYMSSPDAPTGSGHTGLGGGGGAAATTGTGGGAGLAGLGLIGPSSHIGSSSIKSHPPTASDSSGESSNKLRPACSYASSSNVSSGHLQSPPNLMIQHHQHHHHNTTNQQNSSQLDYRSPAHDDHELQTITQRSDCRDVMSWFGANRFDVYEKMFANYSGSDLLRLSKPDLIEICGLIDGIRLYNSLHCQPIKPRKAFYVRYHDSEVFHPIYLYDVTLHELIAQLSSSFANHLNTEADLITGEDRQEQINASADGLSVNSDMSVGAKSSQNHSPKQYGTSVYSSMPPTNNSLYELDENGRVIKARKSSSQGTVKPMLLRYKIDRLLIEGLTFVKVKATDQVVQQLADESAWIFRISNKDSSLIEACLSACDSSR